MGRPSGGRISSGYGMRRHPILGYKRMHAGVDFAGGYGAPIHAATDGTVTVAGRTGGFGNYVKLSHGGGLGTGYGHMSRIAVRRGQHLRRGQVIGHLGSPGLATGPTPPFAVSPHSPPAHPNSATLVPPAPTDG